MFIRFSMLSFIFVMLVTSVFVILYNMKYSYIILGLVLYGFFISVIMCTYYNLFIGLLFLLVYVGGLLLFMLYVLTMVGISEKTVIRRTPKAIGLIFLFFDLIQVQYVYFNLPSLFGIYTGMYSFIFIIGFLLGLLLYMSLELLYFG